MSQNYQSIPTNTRIDTGAHACHAFVKLPPGARALAAFDWYAGHAVLIEPTLVLAAKAYGTSVHDLRLAGQVANYPDLCEAVQNGSLPLSDAARFAAARTSFFADLNLDEALAACDSDETLAAYNSDETLVEAPGEALVEAPVVVHAEAPPPTLPAPPPPMVATETAAVAPRLSMFWRVVEQIAHPF